VNVSPSFRREFFRTKGADPQTYLLYLQEGSFSLTVEGESFRILPGTVVFFSPETETERHVLDPIRFLYIRFNRNPNDLFWVGTKVFDRVSDRAREDLRCLERLTETRGAAGLALKSHYFNDLLLCLAPPEGRWERGGILTELPSSLQRALSFMGEHLQEKISVGQIAAYCSLSPTSLEVLFRSYLETSVYGHLIAMRMEKAKIQLTDTPYSVGEIASHCGFDNGFYFCNAFKKRFGMTPTAYRNANRL